MTQPKTNDEIVPASEPPAETWPRPTLVALPALCDLTLQSGVTGNVGTASLLSFGP